MAETYFVRLKNAQDTLIHPAKKYAYDRFGPDILAWQNCSSIRDYLLLGLQSSCMPIYLGGGMVMGLLAFTGYLQWGRYVSAYSILRQTSILIRVVIVALSVLCIPSTSRNPHFNPTKNRHSLLRQSASHKPHHSSSTTPFPTHRPRTQGSFFLLHRLDTARSRLPRPQCREATQQPKRS